MDLGFKVRVTVRIAVRGVGMWAGKLPAMVVSVNGCYWWWLVVG